MRLIPRVVRSVGPHHGTNRALAISVIGIAAACSAASPPGDYFLNRQWPINKQPYEICLVDLNGDALPDLVSCGGYGLKVSLNAGSQAFDPPTAIDAMVGLSVGGADLDGDTDMDLVIAAGTSLRVLLNDGSGSMGPAATIAANGARLVELGDLTGDGRPDVVSINSFDDTISVFLNDGAGNLALPVDYPSGDLPQGAVIADIDGDLDNDVVVAIRNDGAIGVFLNDGTGALAPLVTMPLAWPRSVVGGDFDGDGDVDIAVGAGVSTTSSVTILFNSGTGAFTPGAALALPDAMGTLAAADLDGDLDTDLAYSAGNDATYIRVLPNNGSGVFSSGSVWAIGFGPYAVRIADLDGDGDQDLAEPDHYPGTATVLFNAGGGVFRTEFNQSVALAFGVPQDGDVADVDGDGDLDALCITDPGGGNPGSMSVVLNNGLGVFSGGSVLPVGLDPSAIAAGDLNGDTFADAVIVHTGSDTVGVLLSTGPAAYAAEVPYAVGDEPYRAAIGDVTGDGVADIAVCNFFSHTVTMLFNTGAGVFVAGPTVPVGTFPQALALADVNGDTLFDLIATSTNGDSVSVNINTGAGVFGAPATFAAGDNPVRILATDVDGDLDIDLIVSNDGSGSLINRIDDGLTILVNNGSGSFGSALFFEVVDRPRQIAFEDIDLSGTKDIVVVSGGSGDTVVLLSDGPLSFPESREYAMAIATVNLFGSQAIGTGDFDGDTDIDVLSVCTRTGVTVALNRLLTPVPACAGDVNGDGVTNAADFTVLAGNFGSAVPPNTGGDLNGDGLVNAADFVILAGDFGCDAN